ncbi:hypothetical protein D9M69_637420 [compost metagenome]
MRRQLRAFSVAWARDSPWTRIGAAMTLSSTLRCAHRLKFWKTIASCVRRRCSWRLSVAWRLPSRWRFIASGRPSQMISPALGRSSRFRQRRKVLLPDPLEPIRVITSPGLATSETPLSTWWSP